MDQVSALVSGAVIGLAVSAPVGPMAILCMNRTLEGGIKSGISTGAGATTVLLAYAVTVLLGLRQIEPWLTAHRAALSLLAAALMLLFAYRILRRSTGARHGVRGPRSALVNYASAVAFCSTNPMTCVLLLGAVGVVTGGEVPAGNVLAIVLIGIFLGSIGWWIGFSAVIAALRSRLRNGILRTINCIAAAAMVSFGAISLARATGL